MKQYETVNWYEKDTDRIYNYLYEQLEKEDQYPFFVWLMQHFPEVEIDWLEIFEYFMDELFQMEKIEAVLSFVTWYKQQHATDYSQRYEFIERDLCDYYLYKKDDEKLQERIAFIQQNPVPAIDTLTIRLLYQLIYHGHYELAVSYAQNVWKPINESDKLYGFPAFPFINTIYVNLLQQHYEAILRGMPLDEDKLHSQMIFMGFEEDKSRFREILLSLSEDLSIEEIWDSIQKDRDDHMLILNVHFLKYMLHTYQLPFVFSEWIWNFIATTKIFGKQKVLENWFYINAKTLDKHLDDRLDTFYGSNELEVFGKVWGLDYVFDFLHKKQLLSYEHYGKMIENITYFRSQMMRFANVNLWQMMFVFDWPRTNNYIVDPSEKRMFNETYCTETTEARERVIRYLSFCQIPDRIKKELKLEESRENRLPPIWSENKPYVKADPYIGRNDLCPCGSGKKHKKCCINK